MCTKCIESTHYMAEEGVCCELGKYYDSNDFTCKDINTLTSPGSSNCN